MIRQLVTGLVAGALTALGLVTASGSALAASGPCGTAPAAAPTHVLVVMLENESNVIGNAAAPYQNSLASSCGYASSYFGVTHTSAANYLALTGGAFPPASPPGCPHVSTCASSGPSLFSQLDAAGLSWKNYAESMPVACDKSNSGVYKFGHNPAVFYPLADCKTNDVGVPDLTASSGAFYSDLTGGTFPSLAFVTPNNNDDGDGTAPQLATADAWLSKFVPLVTSSPLYQSGQLVVVVTYDEGRGHDAKAGEDCTNRVADLAGSQPSCHVPTFVISPSSSGSDSTFFTHYSVTRTVDDVFGLTPLGAAATATSLVGHFGIS